jgi:hypothetical protein
VAGGVRSRHTDGKGNRSGRGADQLQSLAEGEFMTQPPMRYADIIGQEDSIARLTAFSDFYRKNGSTAEHILIVAEV